MATILVVDDEPKITRLVRDYLESAGFTVVTAADGREALMRARTDHPDLVVLDLGLPQLDGLDVTRRLRRDGDLPIIMLTARDDETDKLIGLIRAAFGRGRWGGGGHGGWEGRRERMEELHRELHRRDEPQGSAG